MFKPSTRIPKLGASLLTGLLLCATSIAQAATMVYVSNADSQEVSVLELDKAKGSLTTVDTVKVGGTAMPMSVSADKKFLYVALRSQPFRVVTFSIDQANGRLTRVGEASLADSMPYISTDRTGRWMFAASFGGNKITVNDMKDGSVGAVRQILDTAPNAHAIQADAKNRFVLATSLGGDNMSIWRFDAATGKLTAHDTPLLAAKPKSGPRHFVWDASQRFVYLVGELDASLTTYAWDGEQGKLTEVQRSTLLPAGFTGKPWAAELRMAPGGKFLYASERTSSTISIFRVDAASGRLEPAGQVSTEKTPRGFAIDPSGSFIVVAGQESHSVSVHAIDKNTGALGAPSKLAVGKNPNWVEIIDLP